MDPRLLAYLQQLMGQRAQVQPAGQWGGGPFNYGMQQAPPQVWSPPQPPQGGMSRAPAQPQHPQQMSQQAAIRAFTCNRMSHGLGGPAPQQPADPQQMADRDAMRRALLARIAQGNQAQAMPQAVGQW